MANESLQRHPTSSGNRKSWTLSGWCKITKDFDQGTVYNTIFSVAAGTANDNSDRFHLYHLNDGQWQVSGTTSLQTGFLKPGSTDGATRDTGWVHFCLACNTTEFDNDGKIRFWLNGIEYNFDYTGGIAQDTNLAINGLYNHFIGKRDTTTVRAFDGNMFDFYLVDGQSLTADYFGYHKDQFGYVSAATMRGSEIKNGQWVPKKPSIIIDRVNKGGGFGVNGAYLPMNDSSNPGADFHCAPNSIIKLKGENLPQPRNGAPVTTDNFVSQLRQETGTLGFDGAVKLLRTGGYLDLGTSHSDLVPGSGDFTIECFLYPQEFGNYPVIVDSRTNSGDTLGFFLGFNTNGLLYLYTHSGERNAITLTKGRWYHIALVRQSNVFKLYVDGVKVGTDYTQSQNYTNQIRYIGESPNSESQNWNIDAFISNFRFVKGTAVYTANFTPPTEPLTNVTNTKLLCCNSSTSATAATVAPGTITAVGGAFATRNELTGSIVLAVPFISPSTSSNLVANGYFDTNTDGWNPEQYATLSVDNGRLKVLTTNANYGSANQTVNGLTIGKNYTFQVDMIHGNGSFVTVLTGATGSQQISGWQSSNYTWKITFTATTTWLLIDFQMASNSNVYGLWDNVILKETDALYDGTKDYSADIKGSGTNKTLTVTGGFAVSETDSYYGSALTSGNTNRFLTVDPHADFENLANSDHTIEFWYKNTTWTGSSLPHNEIIASKTSPTSTTVAWRVSLTDKNSNTEDGLTLFGDTYSNTKSHTLNGNWNHCAIVYHDGKTKTYLNGVVASTISSKHGYSANYAATGPLIIGADARQNPVLGDTYIWGGSLQDIRIYRGVAKYKGGFDTPRPWRPHDMAGETWRTVPDNCRNNFAIMTPLNVDTSSGATASSKGSFINGGLTLDANTANISARADMSVQSGKWYYEVMKNGTGNNSDGVGVVAPQANGYNGTTTGGWTVMYRDSGGLYIGNGSSRIDPPAGFLENYHENDIIGVALNIDDRYIEFYKNGVFKYREGIPNHVRSDHAWTVEILLRQASAEFQMNFGQNPSFCGHTTAGTYADTNGNGLFKYQPPDGCLAWCTDNLPTPTIPDPGEYFKTVTWDGDSNMRSITGVGFKPDFVWAKSRSHAVQHYLVDSVRGPTIALRSDEATDETSSNTWLQSFDSNGFSVGTSGGWNGSTNYYVAWCWKAGGKAVGNNDGTISSLVSANQTSGFSIVSYSGNSIAGATIGHGLGKKPAMMMVKERNGGSGWFVYHRDLGATKFLPLHDVTAATVETGTTSCWHETEPTDLVFSVGQNGATNEVYKQQIAYCWAEIEGFSKFGEFIGNGTTTRNGPLVYCGFKPAFVLIRNTSTAGSWVMFDNVRCSGNPNKAHLLANAANVESISNQKVDFLANGFKITNDGTNYGDSNGSGNSLIFAAFAESPFKTANAK